MAEVEASCADGDVEGVEGTISSVDTIGADAGDRDVSWVDVVRFEGFEVAVARRQSSSHFRIGGPGRCLASPPFAYVRIRSFRGFVLSL